MDAFDKDVEEIEEQILLITSHNKIMKRALLEMAQMAPSQGKDMLRVIKKVFDEIYYLNKGIKTVVDEQEYPMEKYERISVGDVVTPYDGKYKNRRCIVRRIVAKRNDVYFMVETSDGVELEYMREELQQNWPLVTDDQGFAL